MASENHNIAPTGTENAHSALQSPITLTLIFGHLSVRGLCNAALVCHLWKETAYHPSLWRNCKVVINHKSLAVKDSLTQRCIQHGYIIGDDVTLHHIDQNMPSVINLELKRPHLNDLPWKEMSHLTELKMEDYIGFPNQSWLSQATCLANLVTLTFNGNYEKATLTDHFLMVIATCLRKLRYLTLSRCVITDVGIGHLAGVNSTVHPNLEELFLDICPELTNKSLEYLGTGQQQLKRLRLGLINLAAAGLQHMVDMRRLTYLDLTCCIDVDDACMQLVAKLPNLQYLILIYSKVGDTGLELLASGNSKITKLNLANCKNVTDRGLQSLAKLDNLWYLNVSDCNGITDQGLANLSQGRARIHHLNVERLGCSHTRINMLLFAAENLRDLRILQLRQFQINDVGLVSAAHNLRWLHTLWVNGKNVIGQVHRVWTSTNITD